MARLFGISNQRTGPVIYATASLVGLLIAWILATSVFGLLPSRVLPSPFEVVARIANLLVDPFAGATLFGHALASLLRWSLGVGTAIVLGISVGVLFGWVPLFRVVVNPVFELLRYIPPFAWVPIAILWFGASTATQAIVVFIAAFPAVVINTQLGVQQVDGILVSAARVFGADPVSMLRRVVVPVASPVIFTGIRIAISNGWMALVGAELVVGKVGLGFLISQGQQNDSVSTIFAGIISIGLLGVLFDTVVQRAMVYALPWHRGLSGNDD